MHWTYTGISSLEAMEKVNSCISRMVERDSQNGEGFTPAGFHKGLTFLDTLMRNEKTGKYYIWYNDRSGSTDIAYEL